MGEISGVPLPTQADLEEDPRFGAARSQATAMASSTARAAGASRSQIAVTAIAPLVFNRTLLFFFYRWETCVRDATSLGLLGIGFMRRARHSA